MGIQCVLWKKKFKVILDLIYIIALIRILIFNNVYPYFTWSNYSCIFFAFFISFQRSFYYNLLFMVCVVCNCHVYPFSWSTCFVTLFTQLGLGTKLNSYACSYNEICSNKWYLIANHNLLCSLSIVWLRLSLLYKSENAVTPWRLASGERRVAETINNCFWVCSW